MIDVLKELDTQLFLFLNGLNAPWLDEPMYQISYRYNWVPFYAFLGVLVWMKYRLRGLWIFLFTGLLITLSDQSANLVKDYFARLRPGHEPEIADLVHLVRDRRGGRFGFVSGHASNSFALAAFMIWSLRDRFAWILPLMVFWAVLKSYSRIYLGVHYPADVLAGAMLGLFWAWVVYRLHAWLMLRVYPDRCGASLHPGPS